MNVRCDGRSFPQKWGRDRHSPSPSLFYTPHASWKLQIAPAMAGVSGWLAGWLVGWLAGWLPALGLCPPQLRAYYRAIIEPAAK